MVMVSSSLFVTLLIVFFSGYHTCGVVGMAPVLRNSLFRAALYLSHFLSFFHAGTVVGMDPVLLNSLLRAALSSSLLGRAGKIP